MQPRYTGQRRKLPFVLGLCLVLNVPFGFAETPPPTPEGPRILVLAVDGVPYRTMLAAREQGGFEGWSDTAAMVSPFPSMTNVSFTAVFRPFGLEPIEGYEAGRYDVESNEMVDGVFGYKPYPWKKQFDLYNRSLPARAKDYTVPVKAFRDMFDRVTDLVMESDREVVYAYLLAPDNIGHYSGGDAIAPFLVELSEYLEVLVADHETAFGRPLRIVMFSDHGNTGNEVLFCKGLKKQMKKAGFRVRKRLKKPNDIVMPYYGVVSYAALFTSPSAAADAALVGSMHPCVDLAAWISGDREMTVLAEGDRARVRWRDDEAGRRFAYETLAGDPLRIDEERQRLAGDGLLDADGFAGEEEWFAATAFDDFPDPMRRLVDSLTGRHVRDHATVILSLKDGWAVGLTTARMGAGLRAGHLGGTHGALDRDSSLGIYMTNDPTDPVGTAVPAEKVLLDLAPAPASGAQH